MPTLTQKRPTGGHDYCIQSLDRLETVALDAWQHGRVDMQLARPALAELIVHEQIDHLGLRCDNPDVILCVHGLRQIIGGSRDLLPRQATRTEP